MDYERPVPSQIQEPEVQALTTEQVAKRIGIGRTKATELILRGEIKSIKVGRCRRVLVSDLREWLEAQRLVA